MQKQFFAGVSVSFQIIALLVFVQFAAAQPIVRYPTADTYVRAGNFADQNYGTAGILGVREGAGNLRMVSFFTFDTTGVANDVHQAKLRVHAKAGSGTLNTTVFGVSTPTWVENQITWNSGRPEISPQLSTFTVFSTAFAWYEIDVTTFVRAEKAAGRHVMGFALTNFTASSFAVSVYSRESVNDPELVLTPNQPPTVTLAAPSEGAVYTTPVTVTLVASPSDAEGNIAKVDFLVNGAIQFTRTSPPWQVDWINPNPKNPHTLKARVTDALNATGDSAEVHITVKDDDNDYDGRSNWNELLDGTNPNDRNSVNKVRLSHFTFNNSSTWVEPDTPLSHTPIAYGPPPYLTGVPSWSGTAAQMDFIPPWGGGGIIYKDIEQDANGVWYPNLNLQNGALRFWFRPLWDGEWLRVRTGITAHRSKLVAGMHKHYFTGVNSANQLRAQWGDYLYTWVYLDPAAPPRQIMLEFHTTAYGWLHNIYWGENLLPSPGWYAGPLPAAGQWVRLEYHAGDVGIDSLDVDGMSFTLYDGRAKWDGVGFLRNITPTCPAYVSVSEEIWFDENLPAGGVLGAENETWDWGLPWSRLLEVGYYDSTAPYDGVWQLAFLPDGSAITLNSAFGNSVSSMFLGGVRFRQGEWNQIVVNFTPTNSQLYVNGAVVTNGLGVVAVPGPAVRATGFRIGSDPSGADCDGAIEELEWFNYPLDRYTIAREYPNFNLPGQTADADYDGRSDLVEQQVDMTNPNDPDSVKPVRLGRWTFDDSTFVGEQGQLPISGAPLTGVGTISGKSAYIETASHNLRYRDVESSGHANINCREGTIRFWFQPAWQSGSGPAEARLIEVGGKWIIGLKDNGTRLVFWENGAEAYPNLDYTINWTGYSWHQIGVGYGPDYTALFIDGQPVQLYGGYTVFPTEAERADNFRIGHSQSGAMQPRGTFDEIETFNYRLTWAEMFDDYQRIAQDDQNLDGYSDFLGETALPASVPFAKAPIVVTGVLEAEQYDRGGEGIGYHSGVHWDDDYYRLTRLKIEACDDLGGGYSVNYLKAADWLQYTFEVRIPGNYTFEARVSHQTPSATGGSFQYQFVDASGNVITYGPTCNLQNVNGWHNVVSPPITLTEGTHRVRIFMVAQGSDAYVGKLNYVSIYPFVPVNQFNAFIVTLGTPQYPLTEGEAGATMSAAQANSVTIQNAVDVVLDAGGGTVQFPVGTFYVAQHPSRAIYQPWDTIQRNAEMTFAVQVYNASPLDQHSNIRIRGANPGETILKSHNRAVSTFHVSRQYHEPQTVGQTNITFEYLTFKGRPHTRIGSNPLGELETGQFMDGFVHDGCGQFINVWGGPPPMQMRNLNIVNCKFINPVVVPILLGEVEDVLIASNRFVFHTAESPDGDMAGPIMLDDGVTITQDLVWVGIFNGSTAYIGAKNVLTTDNYFDGNERDAMAGLQHAADGIVWHQSGGNFFIARNEIRNYGLEAIQLNTGPGAAVQNRFITPAWTASTAAMVAMATCQKNLTGNDADQSYTFVGNSVVGGRHAYLGGHAWITTNDPPYNVHICGNDVDLDPPPPNTWWGEFPATLMAIFQCKYANVSGNIVRRGGYGAYIGLNHAASEFVKNDFGRVDRLSLVIKQTNDRLEKAVVARNVLGSGQFIPWYPSLGQVESLGHIKLHPEDAPRFFLIENDFRDVNYLPNQLMVDPPGAPIIIK